jgi:hypothetical protein
MAVRQVFPPCKYSGGKLAFADWKKRGGEAQEAGTIEPGKLRTSIFVIPNGVRAVKNPGIPFGPSDLKGMLRRAQTDRSAVNA